jgi:hypothetical protein
MTNGKISNSTEMCNQNQAAQERAIFIIPSTDCKHQDYSQVEIKDWDKLHLSKLNNLETQVITLLFDDVEIGDIKPLLTLGHANPVEQIVDKLRERMGVTTTHGLVSRLYQMGLHKLINQ